MTFKPVTATDASGDTFTYFTDAHDCVHFPIAGVKTVTLDRKRWNRIKKSWIALSDATVQTFFQKQAGELCVKNVHEAKLLTNGDGPPGLHLSIQCVADGARVYVSTGVTRETFAMWLAASACDTCGEGPAEHAAGSCLFHPTKYASRRIQIMRRVQAILDTPPKDEEVTAHFGRSSDSTVWHHRDQMLQGVFASRGLWRKAELRASPHGLYLQTPEKLSRGEIRLLGGNRDTRDGYGTKSMTVELTADVLAFVKRVNEVLAGGSIKELRARTKGLESPYPRYVEHEVILEPEGRPEIKLTYLPVGREKRRKLR